MQTVKTASVVVLLMTVLYGGYVSLTTPPEPIPPEVAELITIEDDLNIDSGFPDSLALSEIGETGDGLTTGTDDFAPQAGSLPANTNGTSFADLAPSAESPPADLDALSLAQSPSQGSQSPSQGSQSPSQGSTPRKLPAIGEANANLSAAADRQYPSTGNRIELPDPSSVEFDSSAGTAFRADAMTDLKTLTAPDATPEFADENGIARSADSATAQNQIAQATAVEAKDNLGLNNAMLTADRQYAKDQLKEALATLSVFYDAPTCRRRSAQNCSSGSTPWPGKLSTASGICWSNRIGSPAVSN